jgi:DNA-binding Xre family transcriptional regulator
MTVINHVPRLLAAKFGGKDKVNLQSVAHDLRLTYSTVWRWGTHEQIAKFDAPILEKWCRYLGVGVGDLLEYVPDKPKDGEAS